MFLGFGIPVDVDAECVNVVDGWSVGFLCMCLVAGAVDCCISFDPLGSVRVDAVLCCISFDPCGSVRMDACFAIAGFGGLKSGLTLNHVSRVHGCPSNVLLACVGSKM